ncbi:hypothetical protein AAFZ08_000178 [Campylobacter fetus]|uniref:hypothetical protein n=2 Tax=Campylobacter fetus TaxID=196 RepID=UPI000818A88F|nr:hypothetical protein [Campylobacter fetus]EAH8299332.1 hypothetical protein [Campylobacter fetus]EAJ5689893.1 hypothetical protein [Campylobacter fetus]EAK0427438.1 hypothetical protein [Campylobacter fetus]EAK5304974.1 hypothetical protein [Campylobacter fetus]EAM0407762.1 hypothetical protein [Campylobacter fetus]
MNSKLMSRVGNNFFSVFSEQSQENEIIENNELFFSSTTVSNEHSYISNPQRGNLEQDEWFYMDFSSIIFGKDLLNMFDIFDNTGRYSNLNSNNIKDVNLLFYAKEIDDDKYINLQVIREKNYIKPGRIIQYINDNIKYQKNDKSLIFRNEIDIFIQKNLNRIYFKKFNDLKYFDKRFIDIYREAIKEEVESFKELVKKIDSFSISIIDDIVGQRNRKKIKYIIDNNILDKFIGKGNLIQNYIKKYNIQSKLDFQDDKFIINTNLHLTCFMDIIFEAHYTGEITSTRLLASSNEEVALEN